MSSDAKKNGRIALAIYIAIGVVVFIVGLGVGLGILALCDRSSESDAGVGDGTSQGTTLAVQDGETPFEDAYTLLKNAKLGDTISTRTYLVSVENGIKTYYIHGRYVLVSSDTDTVVQLRDELEVPNTSLSIRQLIETDEDFDLTKAVVSFYSSDGTALSGTLDDTVTSTVTDCVVEYADWQDETETFGIVQSYLFTYGYVPVKITGYYEASDSSSSGADTSVSEDSDVENSTATTEDTTSGSDTEASEAETTPTES